MADPIWRISCPEWGAVFTTKGEVDAHHIADHYDSVCGCRIGRGPEPGHHRIERCTGHPATSLKVIAEVPREAAASGRTEGTTS